MPSELPHIRDWRPAARREPSIRIGIILDDDAAGPVALRTAAVPYRACGLASGDVDIAAGTPIEVRPAGEALHVRIGDALPVSAAVLRLQAAGDATRALRAGDGILVREVVAGRGFHWQKRIDQTLAGTLELRPGRRGIILVNELPVEDYLAGVITAEMSSACPLAMLEAQAIVARAWLLAMTESKHTGEPFDRCNDDCCQRYQGTGDLNATALAAVQRTRGRVLVSPGGGVLDANYAKSCGGVSETPWAVWGLDKPGISPVFDGPADAPERRFFPVTNENLAEYLDGDWLRSTRCYCSPNVVPVDAIERYLGRVDTVDDYFRWTVRYSRAEVEELLRRRLAGAAALAELRDLRVRARGVSGRAYIVEAEWLDAGGAVQTSRIESEYRIRQVLHAKFLYSSAFVARIERGADGRVADVVLRGAGWGHGVGLCQLGALGMALIGHDAETICRHYYPSATLQSVYA